jgi:hypothetical protein
MCTALLLAAALATGACNGNSAADTGVLDTGTYDTGVVDTGTDTGNPSDVQDVTTSDASDASDSATSDAPMGDGSWVDGCYSGRPVRMVEFLNRCTTAETASHTMMAPLVQPDGGVPPLP